MPSLCLVAIKKRSQQVVMMVDEEKVVVVEVMRVGWRCKNLSSCGE